MKKFFTRTTAACAVGLSLLATGMVAQAWEKVAKPAKPVTSEEIRARATRAKAGHNPLNETKPGMGVSGDIIYHFAPSHAPENHMTRAFETRGSYLVLVPQFAGMTQASQAFLASINTATGDLVPLFHGEQFRSNEYEAQSACYHDGLIYHPTLTLSPFEQSVYWNIIDPTTGKVVRTINWKGDALAHPYALTYDPITGKYFGVGFTEDGLSANDIVIIEPESQIIEEVGTFNECGFISNICYNPSDQNLYLFNDSNEVYIYDRAIRKPINAGELTTPFGESLFAANETSSLCYSPLDRCFVATIADEAERAFFLYFIDEETWEVEVGTKINYPLGFYAGSLLCTDPYAQWEAPALPAKPVADFKGNSTTGTISFTVPTTLFSGVAITGEVHTVVTLDDKVIVDKSYAPGATDNINIDAGTGEHKVAITCDMGSDLVSPTATTIFYTGNDSPYSPRNLRYDGINTLTWEAPQKGGAHGGYVNDSELYYDVYFGNVKQNTRPITATSYTFVQPKDMSLTAISVRAVAGGMASEPAVLNEVIGKALELPFEMRPAPDQKDIFKIVDANGDSDTFGYWQPRDLDFKGFMMRIGYYNDPNDWVMLPRLNFKDASKLYNMTFDMGSIMTGWSREDVEIFIGKAADPAAMTTKIYNRQQLRLLLNPETYSFDFSVPEAGEYVIGIRYASKKSRNAHGLSLTNFKISETTKSSDVPGPVDEVTITPGAKGALHAIVKAKVPTLNALGKPLPSDKPVTVYAEADSIIDVFSAQGLPGTEVSIFVEEVKRNGLNRFLITAANDNGNGATRSYEDYIGIDTPKAATDLKGTTSDNNKTLHLEWKAPGEIGENNRYVDTNALSYDIFVLNGVQRRLFANSPVNHFDFSPVVREQTHYWVGPASRNNVAATLDVPFHGNILGDPYELPMYEEYGTTKFDYNPVLRRTGEGYSGVTWSNERSLDGLDLGGTPTIVTGCIIMYSDSGLPAVGEIILPKATTKGISDVIFQAKTWDYADAPKVSLYGCTSANQEKRFIKEINYSRNSLGDWNYEQITLPEDFTDSPWIQLFIHIEFGFNANSYLVLDNYQIKANVDYDMKISAVSAPMMASTGTGIETYTAITNAGLEDNSGSVKVALYGDDGTFLDCIDKNLIRMRPGAKLETYTRFDLRSEWEKYDYLTLRATVFGDNDEVATNNSREAKIQLVKNTLPAVTDLKGKYNDEHNAVELEWSKPDTSYGNYEDMENAKPFEREGMVGVFRNIDLDKRESFPIENLTWPDYELPGAWTVFDTKELGLTNDPRLHPHSGTQYLLARALSYDPNEEAAPQACDWLISPAVVPGSHVSFWYNTLSVQYTEYVEVWVSSTDDTLGKSVVVGENGKPDTCGSFRKLRSFSKSGQEDWELVEFDLPADAKYFAFVYRSYDSFGAMLDDIVFTPMELPEWTIDHYKVFRQTDGNPNFEYITSVNAPGAKLSNVPDVNANYYVMAMVETPKGLLEGPHSNAARVFALSVDDLEALAGIRGEIGAIVADGFNGKTLELYSTDGKHIRSVRIDSDSKRIATAAGVYIVKVGGATAKIVVK